MHLCPIVPRKGTLIERDIQAFISDFPPLNKEDRKIMDALWAKSRDLEKRFYASIRQEESGQEA